jgi:SAM-dependent methyltransferase
MRGYDESSYGDGMADVYDDWYAAPPDTAACVATLARLATGRPALELGAGTGRLAIPLAQRGLEVHALDGSTEMLERLARKPGGSVVHCHVGDMAGDLPVGPFGLVFVAVNTFFGILGAAAQQQALHTIASRLLPDGCFVVEAFVPDAHLEGDRVEVRDLAADRVVLSISRTEAGTQQAMGQFVELRDGQPVRLRPWAIRWATVEQLDAMAAAAGLVKEDRWSTWEGAAFDTDSANHITVYRRRR